MNPSKNDLMAVVTFVHVTDTRRGAISVKDVDGSDSRFDVIGQDLIDNMLSADQFTETKKISLTDMAEILSKSYNTPFTVLFTKKDGEKRKLRGRLIKTEPILGRCSVEDLDFDGVGSRLRLVDNRTLEELIVNGVKYILK